jgi:hypothetical protein
MADKTSSNKTPKNKRRRKNKSTNNKPHNLTPPNFDDYVDSDSPTGSPDKMATGGEEPTLKQMYDILLKVQESQTFLGNRFDSFDARMTQLSADSIAAKKDIANLQLVDQQQQHQLNQMANHMEEIEQRYINNDLVFSGLPNLERITSETILKRISEIYGFAMQHISKYETITGTSKVSKKPFQIIFATLVANSVKIHILDKQKELGQVMWGQLFAEIPENLKMNRITIKTRLTPNKQLILNECKVFSKLYKTQIPFTWASKFNGKILMKELGMDKPTVIGSMHDLDNIKRKYIAP